MFGNETGICLFGVFFSLPEFFFSHPQCAKFRRTRCYNFLLNFRVMKPELLKLFDWTKFQKSPEVRVSITQKVLELWNFTVKNENIGHMSKKSGNGNGISPTESTGLLGLGGGFPYQLDAVYGRQQSSSP